MSWKKDDLLAKARLFANYAEELEVTDPRYPLWMAVSLEMTTRAALSHVNPCLLADIRNGNDDTASNLFYACGILTGDKTPISIGASTVFKRCRVLIPNFTELEARWCIDFSGKRNEELHSGSNPYNTYTTERWLTDFYRIIEMVLIYLGLDLAYLFGTKAASVAQSLIADQKAHIKKQTLDVIQTAKAFFAGLSPEEIRNREATISLSGRNSRRVTCPTGGHNCVIAGEVSHISPPKLDDEKDIVVVRLIVPTNLSCPVCGLNLSGHAALVEAGVGAPFTITQVEDPIDFHGIEILDYVSDEDVDSLIQSRFEPDYGND
jgi:hypothetical protein